MTSQTRTARRQLLIDRWTEKLTAAGDPHAEAHARTLLADMDDLGFDLPASLTEAAPLRPATIADEDSPGRREFRAARAALANRARDTPHTH